MDHLQVLPVLHKEQIGIAFAIVAYDMRSKAALQNAKTTIPYHDNDQRYAY